MNTADAISAIDALKPELPDRYAVWVNTNSGKAFCYNHTRAEWEPCPDYDIKCVDTPCATAEQRNYATLKPNDALAHLNERLAAEVECFERDTGLLLASIKVVRDKEDDSLKALKAHVR